MSSPLERIPSQVLERIAIYAASSTFDWPVEVSYLMQSRALYSTLNIRSAPHVYAEIFASKFDISAPDRRCRSTSSFRAAELVNRYLLLKRCRRADVSPISLTRDLLTALWMLLESDGLNEQQLRNVCFPDYILEVARTHLKGITAPIGGTRDGQACSLGHIIVWLLCLTLRRGKYLLAVTLDDVDIGLPVDEILKMSQSVREELYGFVFPYILHSNDASPQVPLCLKCSQITSGCRCLEDGMYDFKPVDSSPQQWPWFNNSTHASTYHCRLWAVDIPNSSAAAINLASVLLEFIPPKIPSHLLDHPPPLHGPTIEDYLTFKNYSTPLFADSCLQRSRSMLHDLEFRHQLQQAGLDRSHPVVKYSLGTMEGVWEGRYAMIVPPGVGTESSTFQRPIQCALAEYVSDGSGPDAIGLEDLSFSDVLFVQDRSELYVRGHGYRKYNGRMEHSFHGSDQLQHVLLYGETLDNHDRAWDAFKYLGVVYEDGRVVLYRSAKHSDDAGVFAFEGCLRFGEVFVGRWRVSSMPNDKNGIFSMTKH